MPLRTISTDTACMFSCWVFFNLYSGCKWHHSSKVAALISYILDSVLEGSSNKIPMVYSTLKPKASQYQRIIACLYHKAFFYWWTNKLGKKHHRNEDKNKQDHEMIAKVAKCRNSWAEADMSRGCRPIKTSYLPLYQSTTLKLFLWAVNELLHQILLFLQQHLSNYWVVVRTEKTWSWASRRREGQRETQGRK